MSLIKIMLESDLSRQSLASIVVHVASGVLRVLMELVEVCVSTERWLGHPRL